MKQTLTVDTDRQVVVSDLPAEEHGNDFPYFVPALKRAKRKVRIFKSAANADKFIKLIGPKVENKLIGN